MKDVKIHKDLEWLREYLNIALPLVPNLKKLVKISKNSHKKGTIQRAHAVISKYTDEGVYAISLYTSYKSTIKLRPEVVRVSRPYSKIDILVYLAHEVSHITHFEEHTPQHKSLEARLIQLFMKRLSRNGYISEERELAPKNRKQKCKIK